MIKENEEAIKAYYPKLFNKLEKTTIEHSYKIEKTRTDDVTLKILHKENYLYYHSKYDPTKEAQNIIKSLLASSGSTNKNPDVLVIGGLGLGYIAREAVSVLKDSNIIICDYDFSTLKIALENHKLSELLEKASVHFIIDQNPNVLKELLSVLRSPNIKYIFHKAAETINPSYYKQLFGIIHDFKNAKEINTATSNRFEKVWSRNILKNLVDFTICSGVNTLTNTYRDYGCVIVGAGPSLAKNIALLKEVKGYALIIAVDTVFQTLREHDIDPDFVVAVDPQDINKKYFENIKKSNAVLICEPSISPKIMREYKNKLMLGSLFHLIRFIEDITEKKGHIEIGGSVATAAYSIANIMGCNPIAFIGLDLAYSDEETHIKGTYFEQAWFYNYRRFENPYMLSRQLIRRLADYRVRGYYSDKTVKSDRKFEMFKSWFEAQFKKTSKTIIDATEGGSYKKHCTLLSFRKTIDSYFKTSNKRKDFSENITLKTDKDKIFLESILKEMKKILSGFYLLEKEVRRGIRLTDELYKLVEKSIKYNKDITNKASYINQHLDKIEESILKDKNMNSFISLSIQSIINGVSSYSGKENTFNELEKTHSNLRIASQSQILYKGIMEGITFNIKHFCNCINNIDKYLR